MEPGRGGGGLGEQRGRGKRQGEDCQAATALRFFLTRESREWTRMEIFFGSENNSTLAFAKIRVIGGQRVRLKMGEKNSRDRNHPLDGLRAVQARSGRCLSAVSRMRIHLTGATVAALTIQRTDLTRDMFLTYFQALPRATSV